MQRLSLNATAVVLAAGMTLSGCFIKDLVNEAAEGFKEVARGIEQMRDDAPQDIAATGAALKGAGSAVQAAGQSLEGGAPGAGAGAKRLLAATQKQLNVAKLRLQQDGGDGGEAGDDIGEFCTGEELSETYDCPGGGTASFTLSCTPDGPGGTLEATIVANECVDYVPAPGQGGAGGFAPAQDDTTDTTDDSADGATDPVDLAERYSDGTISFEIRLPSFSGDDFDSFKLNGTNVEELSVDDVVVAENVLDGYEMELTNDGMTINGRATTYREGEGYLDLTYTDFVLGAPNGLSFDSLEGASALTIDGQIAMSLADSLENACFEVELFFETLAPLTGLDSGGCPESGEIKIIRRDDSYAQYSFDSGSVTITSGEFEVTLPCGDISFDGALSCE